MCAVVRKSPSCPLPPACAGLFLILPEAKESKLYMALVFYPFAALAMMILCVVFAIATYVPGYTASAADMLLVVCLGYLVAADAGKFVAKSQVRARDKSILV